MVCFLCDGNSEIHFTFNKGDAVEFAGVGTHSWANASGFDF
jgi:hypothetical protein